MKKNSIFLLLCIVFFAMMFASCSSAQMDYSDQFRVVFVLNGGDYKSSRLDVEQFYDFPDDKQYKIYDLTAMDGSDSTLRNGEFVFDGWYRNCVEQDGSLVFSDKWDFNTDTVCKADKELKLYAKWKSAVRYGYDLYSYHDKMPLVTGEIIDGQAEIAGYSTNVGSKFYDYDELAVGYAPNGYTFIEKYVDENGNDWDFEKNVPVESDSGDVLKVYAVYVQGNYTLVHNANELSRASGKSIYLMNDIDMDGKAINFGKYIDKTFDGNGHTVSNFTIKYVVEAVEDINNTIAGKSLYISLFGNAQNATIKNVTFKDVSVKVDARLSKITGNIYVAPLFTSATDCNVSNVKINLAVSIVAIPDGFIIDNKLNNEKQCIVLDGVFGANAESDNTLGSNVECNVTTQDNRG